MSARDPLGCGKARPTHWLGRLLSRKSKRYSKNRLVATAFSTEVWYNPGNFFIAMRVIKAEGQPMKVLTWWTAAFISGSLSLAGDIDPKVLKLIGPDVPAVFGMDVERYRDSPLQAGLSLATTPSERNSSPDDGGRLRPSGWQATPHSFDRYPTAVGDGRQPAFSPGWIPLPPFPAIPPVCKRRSRSGAARSGPARSPAGSAA
ncbi:hypothetical protein SBA3_2260007 [Candidatus Sulfopaludibacter sp. SbA3]|nr:hypothetical protein SBA3_2260007 [Candidatus Sulfopaludibacter sp. SbA3]